VGSVLAKTTPMMQQYSRIKNEYKDSILFFRMGDFYETFYDDAKLVSKELDIALTSRNKSGDGKIPLAGIPYHALHAYLGKLIKKGHKVAICEQVEDPKLAKGIVKREVVRLVTPGTVLESGMLNERTNNYLLSISKNNKEIGLAFVDVSTGEFLTTQLDSEDVLQKLTNEIIRFKPVECILPESLKKDGAFLKLITGLEKGILVSGYDDFHFEHDKAYETLKSHFKTVSLEGMGCESLPLAVEASGAALSYLQDTQKTDCHHIDSLSTYFSSDYMILDFTTLRNLEILKNVRDGSSKGTLLELLDVTKTPMGSRLMRKWIAQPMRTVASIKMRQNAVEELYINSFLRSDLQQYLNELRDIERLSSKIVYGSANARDLISLKESLKLVPKIKSVFSENLVKSLVLKKIANEIDDLKDVVEIIESAISDSPPLTVKEGGIIKKGYNEQLDELKDIASGGKRWVGELESQERKKTGIKSLKVRYNKVFGYYIEVTKANLSQVPEDYIRKQTLVNSERFITPALKEKESMILSAQEKMNSLEYELFSQVRESVGRCSLDIKKTAKAISEMDCLVAMSGISVFRNYIKPEITEDGIIKIEDGRHPVIENSLESAFIPNDSYLDCEKNRLVILTGPNMAGKSTYMRQVALITIMAQMGCFVPAKSASIGLVDRVYTRVGAFDDLIRGQSTFMVEMNELANILNTATENSLIILDEIGRGTSTYDGLSIAWAVAEYIHNKNKIGAKTLFATHYHNLTELADIYEGVVNYNIAIKEDKDGIIFLRKVIPGGTNKSYGIEVAKLAGLPSEAINRAFEVLKTIEEENIVRVNDETSGNETIKKFPSKKKLTQLVLFEPNPTPHPVIEDIKKMDLDNITPLEALNKLNEIKKVVDEEEKK
jgi:DNA mismatch repair protein MutS